MPDSIDLWHSEHINFARLLDLLESQLEVFHKGEAPDYELMLDIVFYMTHYPDRLHHPKEDLAFARIRERDNTIAPMVDELTGQHARLKQIGAQLAQALDDIVNGSIEPREQVERPGRDYIELFRRHMRDEETLILPLAAKLLDDGDWSGINTAIAHVDDPLFVLQEKRYAALREYLAA